MIIKKPSVLLIYTGGTIGMVEREGSSSLAPVDFSRLLDEIPALKKFDYKIDTLTFAPIIDSSNVKPATWVQLATTIKENYYKYDGFVILHGTDTMAYSASALSFMLENLNKPIIFTGSQLPIGQIRTDGKENLITAIEIAAASKNGQALVPEVCIYFENKLFRGNRTTKFSAQHFQAFQCNNYPHFAVAGISIEYNFQAINYHTKIKDLKIHTNLDSNVALLKIFPGINEEMIRTVLGLKNLRGLVLETYGAGNALMDSWFIDSVTNAIKKGMVIINVTQCPAGSVQMGKYETSLGLLKAEVISGKDMTTEAAITKLMFLLGKSLGRNEVIEGLKKSISGEITI